MSNLTIKQLRYFSALCEHRHFGQAAKACSVTQPALSQQMKELEHMVQAPLIERGSRDVRLTALGEVFLARAKDILLSVDELGELARASAGLLTGKVRMGIIPTVAPYLLPDIVAGVRQRFPQLDLELREAVTQSLITDLHAGTLDTAIVALPISEPALREFALFEEAFVLVRSTSQANLPVPSARMLPTLGLLLLEEGHCFRDQALSFCRVEGLQPRQVMEGSSLSTLVQLVGAGMGVTLLPEMALPLETRLATVSVARFPPPAPSRTIGMVWRKANPLADQLTELGAVVRGIGQRRQRQEKPT